MTWVKAENCTTTHPFGEDGWRPALDGHEHWEDDAFPVEEHVPVDPDGIWVALSRDGIASLGLWLSDQGKKLAEMADDESVVDGELVYLALTLMGNVATIAERNGPMLAAALMKVMESGDFDGKHL